MGTEYTGEQLLAIEAIDSTEDDIILVEATAGSGKTTLVIEAFGRNIAKRKTGISLAFNAKIAKENKDIFPDWFDVRTLHSFGYRNIVSALGLTVKSNISPSDFKGRISISQKSIYLSYLNKYCSSDVIKIRDFLIGENVSPRHLDATEKALKQVVNDCNSGSIPISHAVYLKLFQIQLVFGDVEIETDVLFMDEFADINACYYSIFKHIKASKKVVVYDQSQSIYRFNNSINGGDKLLEDFPDICKKFSLTNTFRCSAEIASAVNRFGKEFILTPFQTITGRKVDIESPSRFMILTRTNKELIEHSLALIDNDIKFVFARSYKSILSPIIYIKSGARIDMGKQDSGKFDEVLDENKYIVSEYREYYGSRAQSDQTSFARWIQNKGKKDGDYYPELVRIASIATNFSTKDLMLVYNFCKDKKNHDDNAILGTSFSTKGDAADMVYISEDLNKATQKTKDDFANKSLLAKDDEFLNYYVATTRARKWLINATHLTNYGCGEGMTIDMMYRYMKKQQRI